MTRTTDEINQRQLLCKDLEVLCTQDSTILEEVIDELEEIKGDSMKYINTGNIL